MGSIKHTAGASGERYSCKLESVEGKKKKKKKEMFELQNGVLAQPADTRLNWRGQTKVRAGEREEKDGRLISESGIAN